MSFLMSRMCLDICSFVFSLLPSPLMTLPCYPDIHFPCMVLSCPTVCNPMTQVCQAPLSPGILQAKILEWVAMPSSSLSVMPSSLWPHGLYNPWSALGQNTGVSSLSLLQGDLPNPGIKPRSPTVQANSLPAEPQGKPCIIKSVYHSLLYLLPWVVQEFDPVFNSYQNSRVFDLG